MNLEVEEGERYPVLRTRKTEERQPLPDHIRALVLRRDRYRCVFCGDNGRLEVDHIIPWSAGGSDELDNLRTLCHFHNQDRSNFKVPGDSQRRVPNGFECVYCTKHLQGEDDLTVIYCIMCNKKAPGVPENPRWHPDVDRVPSGIPPAELVEYPMRDDIDDLLAANRKDAEAAIRRALEKGLDDA